MDIIAAMWLCFENGFYTHEMAMEMITTPTIHQYLPFKDALLEQLCIDVYTDIKGHPP